MNIRDAGFWQEIEQLFRAPAAPVQSRDSADAVRCRCSPPQMLDRLHAAGHRANRNGSYVLLVQIQLDGPESVTARIRRLSACLRASDSLCELGSGRLALLLDDFRDPALVPLALEKLVAAACWPVTGQQSKQRPRPCAGASLFPVDGMSDRQIWLSAESALDAAIAAGSGCYRISPMVTGRAAMERYQLSKDLYQAHKDRQFEAVYQPIFNLDDKRIHAVEVFLRWHHPVHGSLAPDLFLPILEESGLIVPVGEQILIDTCHFLASLRGKGHGSFRACVNISSRQLEDSGFLLSVLDALYDADLEPHCLQLEFQESMLSSRAKLVQRVLPELRNAGVHLALDHFGTGDAPLAELVRLPINLIKLDRSLVDNIAEDAVSQAIASGTMALASAAGMQVAAVGVEQGLQTGVLERLGCREVQGRYYSYPLTGVELRNMLISPTH